MTQNLLRRRYSRWLLGILIAALLPWLVLTVASAQQSDDDGEAFFGTLRFEGEPVEGVRIFVTDLGGSFIGEASSDAAGQWRITLPGSGVFRATLDAETLPEGVTLRLPDRETLEVRVNAGRQRPLNFALGEPPPGGPNLGERLAQALLNGVKLGLIVAICSVGLSLIFGTTGLINFAHGELVTFGAIMAWWLNAGAFEAPLVIAAVVGVALSGGLGATLELAVLRPLRARRLGAFQFIVLTIGLSLLMRHVFLLFFGGDPERYTDFTVQSDIALGPLSITPRDLTIMLLSFVVLVGVGAVLQRTRIGKAMRAVSDNVDLAESSGINVNRVILVVWILGAALAGLGGIFLGSLEAVDWLMGFRLLLLMFAAVVLGGLGTAYGAMAGGLVIGIVTEVSTVWFQPEIQSVFALAALIVVLLLRPQGILGQRERVG